MIYEIYSSSFEQKSSISDKCLVFHDILQIGHTMTIAKNIETTFRTLDVTPPPPPHIFPPKQIQWNPREVNTLEVNSRLKSTPHGGPDFFFFV